MTSRYWLNVRDKSGIMHVVMGALAGEAHISFEGDLSRCRGLLEFAGASTEQTPILKRNTTHPILDFVVVPLEVGTVGPILKEVGAGGRLVHDIIHIQIEKQGVLQFGSYDNFHPDGCVVWFGVDELSLQDLKAKGILRSYERAPNDNGGAGA
jgi:hypothetical protein